MVELGLETRRSQPRAIVCCKILRLMWHSFWLVINGVDCWLFVWMGALLRFGAGRESVFLLSYNSIPLTYPLFPLVPRNVLKDGTPPSISQRALANPMDTSV